MTKFEEAVIEEVKRIRGILEDCEATQFTFEITASGRVRDGDVNITFGCGMYSATVRANSVEGAISEHMRRNGWEKRNAGLCLPRVGDVEAIPPAQPKFNDDIPF